MTKSERALLDLIQALLVERMGMSGNWGNPEYSEELRRIRAALVDEQSGDSQL